MGSIIQLVLRRFIGRLLWVAFLATFGIHLCLTLLPAKRLVDPNARLGEQQVQVRQWGNSHYFDWAAKTLSFHMPISDQGTGDWEVREFVLRVNRSLSLCFISFVLAALVGIFFGTFAASMDFELLTGEPGWVRKLVFSSSRWTLFLFSSLPAYIIAYLLFLMFSSSSSLSMAVFALALGSGTGMDIARMTQNTHARQLRSKYVESAIGNGLKTRGLLPLPGYVGWHAFRNSLITVLPVTAMRLPLIVSSAMIVEVVFDLPGMGESLLHALINQDIPMILSIVLISVVFVQACLFAAEFLVFLLHPKALSN